MPVLTAYVTRRFWSCPQTLLGLFRHVANGIAAVGGGDLGWFSNESVLFGHGNLEADLQAISGMLVTPTGVRGLLY